MAKKVDKKKKGPKGKKARAKAKLDRQWGEQPTENDGKLRKGKSRILSRIETVSTANNVPKGEKNAASHRLEEKASNDHYLPDKRKMDSDSDSGPSDNEEETDVVGGAFSKLLKTIQKNKNMNDGRLRKNSRSDYDMEDEDGDEVLTVEEEEGNEEEEENSSVDSEQERSTESNEIEFFDPFQERFCATSPLPQEEAKKELIIRSLTDTEKVAVPHADAMLELQISKSLCQAIGLKGDASKSFWKTRTKESFAYNHDFLKRRWEDTRARNRLFSPLQCVLYPFYTRYADCLINNRSQEHGEQVRELTLMHIVNHVLTTRGRILRHNKCIKTITEESVENDENADSQGETWEDQGFTRPTVLVLLPTRGECYSFLKHMARLLDATVPLEFLDRFEAEYGPPPEDEEEGDDAKKRRRKKVLEEKGKSWQDLFGDQVNDDDDFKIGIALSSLKGFDGLKGEQKVKKDKSSRGDVHLKLYTDFYSSDIIVASPLGLKMTISSETNDGDSDFLSSIEICFMDRSDVQLMQNWDHVNDVLDRLNLLPKNNNETDFSRVRKYFLLGQAANWRQLIMSGDVVDPSILSTFKRFAKSRTGIMKMRRRIAEDEATIANVIVPIRQMFQRVGTQSFASQTDDRMKYMIEKILLPILQNKQKHTLIFIPSYFDFVVVRNYLLKREAEFVTVNEYSRVSETGRGRARFLQGRKPLMLYTGRAHFFLRHKIKGIRHLIFFSLPEHPQFYSDMLNIINEGLENVDADASGNAATTTCLALFTKYEAHALERIVGTKQSHRMLKCDKTSFMFVS